MREFEINLEALSPEVTLIHVAGWLDAHTFEYMEQTVNNIFSEGKCRIAIDLSQVEYISSAGAGVFIGSLATAHEKGGNIVLMNPTEPVKEVFDMLGLSQVFTFAQTKPAALTALKAAK
jgi:anti-sigma B factor antagonist